MDEPDYLSILQVSKRFFQARDRTSHEVRSFLVSKGYSESDAESFIKEAQSRSLIRDSRVLDNFLDLSVHTKKKGPAKILHEGMGRGLSESDIQSSIQKIPVNVIRENCKILIQKKLTGKTKNRKDIFNCIQMMIQKGYEEEMISSVFREMGISLPQEN